MDRRGFFKLASAPVVGLVVVKTVALKRPVEAVQPLQPGPRVDRTMTVRLEAHGYTNGGGEFVETWEREAVIQTNPDGGVVELWVTEPCVIEPMEGVNRFITKAEGRVVAFDKTWPVNAAQWPLHLADGDSLTFDFSGQPFLVMT
jgi:hypothetical protein